MSATAPTMPILDLGREIDKHRKAAETLERAQPQVTGLQELLKQHGLVLTIMPMEGNGTAAAQIHQLDEAPPEKANRKRPKNSQTLGDILYAWFLKHKDQKISIKEAAEVAQAANYQSASDNLYGVVLSLVNQDVRFKKFKKDGHVTIGLSNRV